MVEKVNRKGRKDLGKVRKGKTLMTLHALYGLKNLTAKGAMIYTRDAKEKLK